MGETLDNMDIERPSSRMEDKVRLEALKELEEVRRVRTVTMQGDEMKSEVTKILKDQLINDEHGGHQFIDTKFGTSKPEDKADNHEINQDLPANKAGVNDVKCETRNLEKGETNETINVNDGNQSEVETSNKIKE